MSSLSRDKFTILTPPGEGENKPGTKKWPEDEDENPEDHTQDDHDEDDHDEDELLDPEEMEELIKRTIRQDEEDDDDEEESDGIGGIMSPEQSREILEEEGLDTTVPSPDEIKENIERKLIEIEKSSSGHGSGNVVWARKIMDVLKPQGNWKEELKKFVGKALSARKEFSPSNRRTGGGNIFLTRDKVSSQKLESAIYAVDVSGSMGSMALSLILAEMKAITEAKKIKNTTIIYFDHGVQQVEQLSTMDKMKQYEPTTGGGGGTEYTAPLKLMKEMQEGKKDTLISLKDKGIKTQSNKDLEVKTLGNYDVFFFVTDNDSHAMAGIKEMQPKFVKKFVWVLLDASNVIPPWGDMVVHISSKDAKALTRNS